jgi:hypothetical protein
MACESEPKHGKYMKCVRNETKSLKKAGVISGKEKGAINSCAAKSDYGK